MEKRCSRSSWSETFAKFVEFCKGLRVYSMKVDRSTGIICDQRIVLDGFYISRDYPEQLRRIRFRDPETGNRKKLVFLTNKHDPACTDDRRTVQNPLESRIVFQVDQATSTYQTFHRQQRERGQNANLARRRYLTCRSPLSKRSFKLMPRSTLCDRCYQSLFLRKISGKKLDKALPTSPNSSAKLTN